MDYYAVSLATGAVGLGIMAFGGGLSHGDHAGHSHAAQLGHARGAHSGSSSNHAQGIGARGTRSAGSGWRWTSLLSPRLLVALMVGFGAGGIAAAPLGEPWRLGIALVAATVFETLLVGPLPRFLFRFESREAQALESSSEDEAQRPRLPRSRRRRRFRSSPLAQ